MVKFDRHSAPEKLLRQMTVETVNLLALGGPDRVQEAALPEAGVRLIAKAWGLPREDLEDSLELIRREKELVAGGSSEAALPDDELAEPYDGGMIAELLWGLFEAALRLDDAGERRTILSLALQMADAFDFDDWIRECAPAKNQN